MMKISIVIPVYNEEENLPGLHIKLSEVLKSQPHEYEIIYVDDGSSDKSYKILEGLASASQKVKLIKFARNYGQTAALQAGFQKAEGDFIITMDADLQNNPEDIPKLIKKINDTGADVISGWRHPRRDSLPRRIVSVIANRMISKICGLKLHDYGCTLKIYKSRYVKDLKLYGEMHRFIPAFIHWNGGKVTELKVSHSPRIHGKSSYGMERIHWVILDLLTTKFLTTYSTKPIHAFGSVGIISIGLGFIIATYVVVRKIYLGGEWMSPLFFISIFLAGFGLIFIFLGIIAEILVRIYFTSQGYLPYKIDEKDQP